MPEHTFEALSKVIHSLFDEEPKPPLHVGEVMSCWTYLTILEEAVAIEQIGLNSTTDPEVKNVVHKTLGGASSQASRLKVFMQNEGIPLPDASEPKPITDPLAIPAGAKLTDSEICNLVSIKIATAITTCAGSSAQSIRNDVGLMFLEFQLEAMKYGALIKSVMRKRGWLKIPPPYLPPGLLTHQ
ncbi:DUF3231 family protein [Bacillus sp. T3]|uniref:DUF3231 family protein n=1 Tax=Bacillus sp. T3 TaxID=467262 RepID=UPI002981E92D|nr:DUF3231 family protein [Bacillus sp. T3]